MAIVEVQTPDGRTLEIDVPEGMSVEDAVMSIPGAPAPQEAQGSPWAGIGNRLKRFPTEGILGVLDLPGANIVKAANMGALSWLPDDWITPEPERDLASLVAPGPEPAPYEPESMGEKFAYGAGEVLPIAAGGLATLATKAPQLAAAATSRAPGAMNVMRRMGHGILEAFKRSPKMTTAAEMTAGGAGRIGTDLAAEEGAGPVGQFVAGTGASLAGAVAPAAGVNTAAKLVQKGTTALSKHLTPFIPGGEGAQLRAATELQKSAGDPAAAAAATRAAPEGVTGAQASGDPRLMQLQSKVDLQDPVGQMARTTALEGAEETALDDLARLFGEGTDPAAWQRSVVQRGAPEGANIPVGPVDQMMRAADEAFSSAYDVAKGFPVSTRVMREAGGDIPLEELLVSSAWARSVIAEKRQRRAVADFLQGQFDDVTRRATPDPAGGPPLLRSEDLLEMRSNIRKRIRRAQQAAKSGNNNSADVHVELLQLAADDITKVLESQLPADAAQALRQTDRRFADYKTIEDAVVRSGEAGLTAEKLGAAVRARAPTRGTVARGETGDLGSLASQGRDVSRFYGKPQEAERVVREMNPAQVDRVKFSYKDEMVKRATTGGRLRGDKLLAEVAAQSDTLKTLGYTAADIKRIERIGKTLQMVQRKAPSGSGDIITGGPSVVLRLLASVAGARTGQRVSGGGMGAPLVMAEAFSNLMKNRLKDLTVDEAENLIIRAMEPTKEGRELFAALMTRSTDPVAKQVSAAKLIGMTHSYVAPVTAEALDEDE